MTTSEIKISAPITLPSGATVKNRIFKSAMSEILGTGSNAPTESLVRLYGRWAKGGTGLLVTGNVMVDKTALGEPKNVVLEDDTHMDMLKSWATAGSQNDAHIWVQLNHPGKQSPKHLSPHPVAPSAIGFDNALSKMFATPKALTEPEIIDLINKFARSAELSKAAGFTGVQIHGAHGYLVSQFLSPRHNQRTDQWGGSIENRMRFVLEIYRAIRKAVGPDYPVGIKLNSSDFLKDGFTEEECIAVVKALDSEGIDLVEISGGTYEAPAMTGKRSTKPAGEAYFLDVAEKMAENLTATLVVTGGFRTAEGMNDALAGGKIDMVGVARPLAVDPEMSNKVLTGAAYTSTVKPLTTGVKAIDQTAMLEITWYEQQLKRIGSGNNPKPNEHPWVSLAKLAIADGRSRFRRRRA